MHARPVSNGWASHGGGNLSGDHAYLAMTSPCGHSQHLPAKACKDPVTGEVTTTRSTSSIEVLVPVHLDVDAPVLEEEGHVEDVALHVHLEVRYELRLVQRSDEALLGDAVDAPRRCFGLDALERGPT